MHNNRSVLVGQCVVCSVFMCVHTVRGFVHYSILWGIAKKNLKLSVMSFANRPCLCDSPYKTYCEVYKKKSQLKFLV